MVNFSDGATYHANFSGQGVDYFELLDAEVNRLYDAHVAQKTAEANAAFAEGQKALSSGTGAAAMKQVTGKSMQELQSMSDEELEAFAKEMEAKYGGE